MSESTHNDDIALIREAHAPQTYEYPTEQTYCPSSGVPTDQCHTCIVLVALHRAERVCALVGWTGTGSTEREKALTQVWMEWSDSRPGMSNPDAWPDLDDAAIATLAAQRDATRAATLASLMEPRTRPADGSPS